jgi:hypothetical protein
MTVTLNAGTVTLTGNCGVEEVETLVNYLERQPRLLVDLSSADAIHTALWQALMVYKPKIISVPESSVVANTLYPALNTDFSETIER